MLEFEAEIFEETAKNDGLVVAAKGLNLDAVLVNLFKVYQDPGNLVLVLGASDTEQKYYHQQLQGEHVYVEHESGPNRVEEYLRGGVHFLAARILVVDLLKRRIPVEKVTGIVVLRAHRIFESCNEAFALKLYRQHNKTGFVKAYSNSAQSFTSGFGHVERVMRALFVRRLHVWPRFHTAVRNSLKRREPEVIELHVPVSEQTRKMQTYLLEIMNETVKEVKRLNPGLELHEVTVENCLTAKFHETLQRRADEVWHRLSDNSARLLAELTALRHLLALLIYADPVTFYAAVLECRKAEYARAAHWVLTAPAELLFRHASSLVFAGDREFNPEVCPKWSTLVEILTRDIPSGTPDACAMVLCADQRACRQLNEVLTAGPRPYLFALALRHKVAFKSVGASFRDHAHPPIAREDQSEGVQYVLTLDRGGEAFTQLAPGVDHVTNQAAPTVIVRCFKGGDGVRRSLEAAQPQFVVMYHSDVTAVREIEMYEAHRAGDRPLTVYFLMHTGTVEEQAYLTALRREKEAFEFLIETKANMVVPEEQDGKSEQCPALQRGGADDVAGRNTRVGGAAAAAPPPRTVVVDMREFRSDLPSLIHKRGIDIEPVTITVGDYILTPDICVERKSLSDLIGSLNSGRLYQQCTQMQRFYAQPMLLIEFDQNKAFGWGNDSFNAREKLLLLTIHFPRLRIIWSPSPYATAQLFEELKQGKPEPKVTESALDDLDTIEAEYNTNVYDFVRKLPGVTTKNIDRLLRRGVNLSTVVAQSQEELAAVLGHGADAKALRDAFHAEWADAPPRNPAPPRGRKRLKP